MNPNKALWEKGDFTRIAETMRENGEDLVRQAGIRPGMKVLDLGCGDGTTALPAAKLGADVLGVDIAGNLVAAGNRRAAQAGLSASCRILEGDASDLGGIENKSFDLVISIFGAMFAPRPLDVAREMVRVTKPGGRIIMGNWIPNDPTLVAQVLKVCSAYTPPPPEGFVSPMTWGVESHIVERFAAAGVAREQITLAKDAYSFIAPVPPAEFIEAFQRYYGPTMNAFDAAGREGRTEALRDELVHLFQSQNQSQYPNTTLIAATFLRVTVDVG
jgi:ubiquinone/menaquinone biosynthesis C-methylase UbiE